MGVVQEYAFSQAAAGRKQQADADHWAVLLPNALLACESPFLTLLMLLAFPLSELEAPPPPPLSAGSMGDGPGVTSPLLQSPLSPPTHGAVAPGAAVDGGQGEEDEGEWGVGDLLFTRRGESLGSLERGNSSDAAAAAAAARVPSSTEYIR